MSEWRIYYGDGTTASNVATASDSINPVDSQPYTPLTVPANNVQIIVLPDAYLGRFLYHGYGYYYFDNASDMWFGVDGSDVQQALEARNLLRWDTQQLTYEWNLGNRWVDIGQDPMNFRNQWRSMGALKYGQTIDTTVYRELYVQALYDADFPDKNGYYPDEKRPDSVIFNPPTKR